MQRHEHLLKNQAIVAVGMKSNPGMISSTKASPVTNTPGSGVVTREAKSDRKEMICCQCGLKVKQEGRGGGGFAKRTKNNFF